jgi:O-antigen ligase
MDQYRGRMSRTWLAWGSAVAVVIILTVGVLYATNVDVAFGAATLGLLAVIMWLALPSKGDKTPKWVSLFLLALAFSTVLPSAASYAVQMIALAGGFVFWLMLPSDERRGKAVVIWAALVIGFWAVLMFHPNIPGLDVGILGLRKTVLCVAGVVAGASIPRRLIPAVERSVAKVLVFAVAASIGLHLFAPAVEASIGRSAGEYTALLGGEARLQGVFAGPFHVALGCLLLIGWGLVRFNTQRTLALVSFVVGFVGMYLSLVRTAYVALALVVVIIILLAPTFAKFARRIGAAVAIAAIGTAVLAVTNPAILAVLNSVADFSTDTRFQGRFPGYQEGIALFQQSPIFGWGSGSAGDTLTGFFLGREHITSHNIFLKIAVEGGLLGIILWVGLIVSIVRRMRRVNTLTVVAGASLAAVVGMGLTVASLEALPLSYFAFFLVGLALEGAPIRQGPAGSGRALKRTVPGSDPLPALVSRRP